METPLLTPLSPTAEDDKPVAAAPSPAAAAGEVANVVPPTQDKPALPHIDTNVATEKARQSPPRSPVTEATPTATPPKQQQQQQQQWSPSSLTPSKRSPATATPPPLQLIPGSPTKGTQQQRLIAHLDGNGLGANVEPDLQNHGFVIAQISSRSSLAHKLGLTVGDVIVQLNKESVNTWTMEHFYEEVKKHKTAIFDIIMCQRQIIRMPAPTSVAHSYGLGLRAAKKTPGFRVHNVDVSCPADLAGLQETDLLLAINDVDITGWALDTVYTELSQPSRHVLTVVKGDAYERGRSKSLPSNDLLGSTHQLIMRARSRNEMSKSNPENVNEVAGANNPPNRRASSKWRLGRSSSSNILRSDVNSPPASTASLAAAALAVPQKSKGESPSVGSNTTAVGPIAAASAGGAAAATAATGLGEEHAANEDVAAAPANNSTQPPNRGGIRGFVRMLSRGKLVSAPAAASPATAESETASSTTTSTTSKSFFPRFTRAAASTAS